MYKVKEELKEEEPVEIIMWIGTEVASPIPIEQLYSNIKR